MWGELMRELLPIEGNLAAGQLDIGEVDFPYEPELELAKGQREFHARAIPYPPGPQKWLK